MLKTISNCNYITSDNKENRYPPCLYWENLGLSNEVTFFPSELNDIKSIPIYVRPQSRAILYKLGQFSTQLQPLDIIAVTIEKRLSVSKKVLFQG